MKKSTLKTLSDNTFTTNGVRGITAASHRSFNNELIETMYTNPGSVLAWAGLELNIPLEWKLCNGETLSKTLYPDLFNALGGELSPWGVQATTFSLPNMPIYGSPVMANRVNENVVNGQNKLGLTGGEQNHTLLIAEMPRHDHIMTIPLYAEDGASSRIANAGSTFENTTFQGTTGYTGNSDPHNNMQPFAAMYWIIKIV